MPTFYLPIGMPGSGKTTLMNDIVPVSSVMVRPDDIREWLTDDKGNQECNQAVFDIVRKVIWERIKRGLDVCLDATNLVPSHFLPYLDMTTRFMHDYNIAVYRFTNIEQAYERNNQRSVVVPEHAMSRMEARHRSLDLSVLSRYPSVSVELID